MGDASGLQLRDRALQQRILDVIIKARLDDQRPRAGYVGLILLLCAPRVYHLVPADIDLLVQVLGAAASKAKGCFYFISESRAA